MYHTKVLTNNDTLTIPLFDTLLYKNISYLMGYFNEVLIPFYRAVDFHVVGKWTELQTFILCYWTVGTTRMFCISKSSDGQG